MIKDSEKTYKPIDNTSELLNGLTEENAIETNTEANTEDLQTIDKNYLRNRVIDSIKEYETENGIDVKAIKQIQFNSVLEYISDTVIKPLKPDIRNIFIIDCLVSVYISIARYCSKTSSIYGFSIFSSIPYKLLVNSKDSNSYDIYIDIDNDYKYIDSQNIGLYRTIYKYKDDHIIRVPNNLFRQAVERIRYDREHTLTDKVEDGSVMSLALGKIEYAWIESAKEKIQVEHYEKYRLPTDIIKELTDN